jgi:predicted transcriptional regulator
MKNGNKDQVDDPLNAMATQLREIKGLLVLLLVKGGATQTEIAKALGTTQGTVSKQFRLPRVKPFEAARVNLAKGQEA